MKFISIDIETLGLDLYSPIIEVGAVLVDTQENKVYTDHAFHTYVTHHEYDNCEPYAMSMHPEILRRIATRGEGWSYINAKDVWHSFCRWESKFKHTWPNGKFVVAGKNAAGFDMPMLYKQCRFNKRVFHHRVLDPGCMWLRSTDETPPTLTQCMERAGVKGAVEHTAVSDAIQTAEVILAHFEQMKDAPVKLEMTPGQIKMAQNMRRWLREGGA